MKAIGLDIGTTTICAVVIDPDTGGILDTVTVPNNTFLEGLKPWEKLQDPIRIYTKAAGLAEELLKKHPSAGCIGISGQMHGIVYVDETGEAVSPLHTWQDGRGDLAYENGKTYSERLSEITGYKVATGYGAATHFYNMHNGLVPEAARYLCTIHDYVAMKLTGRRTPLMNPTNAASLGLFDLDNGVFDFDAIKKSGMDAAIFPEVVQKAGTIGTTAAGIPVAAAIGDNQASFTGSVREPERSVLVNVGTGSQISLRIESPMHCPNVETRPSADMGFLQVGSSLCGGRAYAILENFFRSVAAMACGVDETGDSVRELYGAMERTAEKLLFGEGGTAGGSLKINKLDICTKFNGTRDNPLLRGSISNIGIDNFTPGHFIAGVLEGIAGELYERYEDMLPSLGTTPSVLVGSGNGIRKNRLLQKIFSEKFGMPLRIPVHKEEAAYGAALFALTAAGSFRDIAEAQKLICYQDGE
jgi:sedoheptulokinase